MDRIRECRNTTGPEKYLFGKRVLGLLGSMSCFLQESMVELVNANMSKLFLNLRRIVSFRECVDSRMRAGP